MRKHIFETLETLNHKMDEVLAVVSGATKSLYTVEEVAALTGRSPYTVRRWINEQRISATRIADTGPRGRLLVAREELQRLINSGRGDSIPPVAINENC
jgi:excisionase family DNA binding protein